MFNTYCIINYKMEIRVYILILIEFSDDSSGKCSLVNKEENETSLKIIFSVSFKGNLK